MKKVTVLFSLSLISAAYLSLTGCQIVASPMAGGIYNETKYGDVATIHNTATKEGKACGQSILGWVATGDASVSAAKAAGGITTVSLANGARSLRAADHACCPSEERVFGILSRRPFFLSSSLRLLHGTVRRVCGFPSSSSLCPVRFGTRLQ